MTDLLRHRRWTRPGPFVGTIAVFGLVAFTEVSRTIRRGSISFEVEFLWVTLFAGSASLVGAMILRGRPGHGVGRVCLFGGLVLALSMAGREAVHAWPTGFAPVAYSWLVFLASIGMVLGLITLGPLLAAVFPSGRVGPWSRRIGLMLIAAIAPPVFVTWAADPTISFDGLVAINPLYIRGLSPVRSVETGGLATGGYVLSMILATVGIAARYRRADAVGRLQIRWVAANFATIVIVFGLILLSPEIGDRIWWMMLVLAGLTPASVAIAVLRYRLYDIDRIVSNAVGYGLVSVVLLAVFWAVNLALQDALSDVTGGGPFVVAASTLLVAALFSPVRMRIQAIVDRRFHRAHYDAERLVAGFAGRLRDDLDLDHLATELTRTTTGAVSPTTASIWFRATARTR